MLGLFNKKEKEELQYFKELVIKLKNQLIEEEDKRLELQKELKQLETKLKAYQETYDIKEQSPLVKLLVKNEIPLGYALKCSDILEKQLDTAPPQSQPQQEEPTGFSRSVVK